MPKHGHLYVWCAPLFTEHKAPRSMEDGWPLGPRDPCLPVSPSSELGLQIGTAWLVCWDGTQIIMPGLASTSLTEPPHPLSLSLLSCLSETESHSVALPDFKLALILLPLPPECQCYRHKPSRAASLSLCLQSRSQKPITLKSSGEVVVV